MAGLERETPGGGGQRSAGTDCFVRTGDETDSNWGGGEEGNRGRFYC